MFNLFKGPTAQSMRAQLLANAEKRLVEAEHAENHWRHEADKAREEITRLSGRKVVETTFTAPAVKPVAAGPIPISEVERIRRAVPK